MRRLAVLVEAHLLGPQDDEAIRTGVLTFRAADDKGQGCLAASDIENALRSQRLEVPDDLTEICEALDINGDGTVNLTEFIASTMDPVRGSYTRRIASNTLRCPDSHAPYS